MIFTHTEKKYVWVVHCWILENVPDNTVAYVAFLECKKFTLQSWVTNKFITCCFLVLLSWSLHYCTIFFFYCHNLLDKIGLYVWIIALTTMNSNEQPLFLWEGEKLSKNCKKSIFLVWLFYAGEQIQKKIGLKWTKIVNLQKIGAQKITVLFRSFSTKALWWFPLVNCGWPYEGAVVGRVDRCEVTTRGDLPAPYPRHHPARPRSKHTKLPSYCPILPTQEYYPTTKTNK